jgi:hypothetical protein
LTLGRMVSCRLRFQSARTTPQAQQRKTSR